MIRLKRAETPRRYELSWHSHSQENDSKDFSAIVIRIHQSVANNLPEIPNDASLVKSIADNFSLDSFTGDLTHSFGFEKALVRRDKDGGNVELIGQLPSSKNDESIARTTTETFWPLAASITLLLQHLNYSDTESSSSRNHLIKAETSFTRDSRGNLNCAVGGVYSSELVSWLAEQLKTELKSVTKAMKSAYRTMIGVKEYEQAKFETEVREGGWLNTSCPGDRCGLYPVSSTVRQKGVGAYEFQSHNVDTAVQMLTLISALAALHDRAKIELDTK